MTQIGNATQHSIGGIDVDITTEGRIVGTGVTGSAEANAVCGGNLDNILRSFGGIEGGSGTTVGDRSKHVVRKTSKLSKDLSDHLEKELTRVNEHAFDLETLATMAQDAIDKSSVTGDAKKVIEKIISHVNESARAIRSTIDKKVHAPKQRVRDFIERNGRFINAIDKLGANVSQNTTAGMLSLSFTSINGLKRLAEEVSEALKITKSLGVGKNEFLSKSMCQLDNDITKKLANSSYNLDQMKKILGAWTTLMQNYGHRSELQNMISGGSMADKLADRLLKSRNELKTVINSFIKAFGVNINGIATSATEIAQHLGKEIAFGDETAVFLDIFARISEYLTTNENKICQHLLELNSEQVDSKEIKDRFLSNMKDLANRTDALGSQPIVRQFSSYCQGVIEVVNKFADMVKNHRDIVKKEGGSSESMNELFSVDASKIDISGLLNSLQNLKVAIRKIKFFVILLLSEQIFVRQVKSLQDIVRIIQRV